MHRTNRITIWYEFKKTYIDSLDIFAYWMIAFVTAFLGHAVITTSLLLSQETIFILGMFFGVSLLLSIGFIKAKITNKLECKL